MDISAAFFEVPQLLYMTNPFVSNSFKYTMRAETRPEGRDAVERHTVSGCGTADCWARENQALNWMKGEGESSFNSRVPLLNCSAWVLVLESAGATVLLLVRRL